jgi:hypothetical protein
MKAASRKPQAASCKLKGKGQKPKANTNAFRF